MTYRVSAWYSTNTMSNPRISREVAILGGRISGANSRAQALAAYDANPNHCHFCNKKIEVPDNAKVCDIRRRSFCSISCTQHNRWSETPRTMKSGKVYSRDPQTGKQLRPSRTANTITRYNKNPKICVGCQKPILASPDRLPYKIKDIRFCSQACAYTQLRENWKGAKAGTRHLTMPSRATKHTQIFKTKKEAPRKSIWRFARLAFGSLRSMDVCECCGSTRTLNDVAHVKAINSFPDEAFIYEINQISNLICLCPNCHRAFDSGLIPLETIKEKVALREEKRPLGFLLTEEKAA